MRNIKRPASRKIAIKFAALDCFLEKGFTATSMADIRKRSGATTGSIYHFYAGKSALALELTEESLASWGDAITRLTQSDAPRDRVRGSVLGLLDWARTEPGQFRFLDELRALARTQPELETSVTRIHEEDRIRATLYAFWTRSGDVRPLPWAVARALIFGPAQTFANSPGFAETGMDVDALIADAAWQAVAIGT